MLHLILIDTLLFLESFGQIIVTTNSGKVMGKRISIFGKDVDAFLGIPYAAPPIGNLRFSEPKDAPKWQNIYNATKKSSSCMQAQPLNFTEWSQELLRDMNEDCLYLNIWVPVNVNIDNLLSTMVWIHGGGFNTGSSNLGIYDGSLLASLGEVIMVSFNYRLGTFGFLYFPETEAIGNAGILDQVKALTWINQNIEAFGGDPDEVTLFGQSAGAWAVSLHLVSPLSKGLFKRAILQSGSAYNPGLTFDSERSLQLSLHLGKLLQCYDNHAVHFNSTLNCMKNKAATVISDLETHYLRLSKLFVTYLPQTKYPFLLDNPVNYFDNCKIHDVDVMLGTVEDEGSIFLIGLDPAILKVNFPIITKAHAIEYLRVIFKMDEMAFQKFVIEYFKDVEDYDYPVILKRTSDAVGDRAFNCPTEFLTGILANNKRIVFRYTFRQKQALVGTKRWVGVPHSAELFFLFGMPFLLWQNYTDEEREFSKSIIELWTSFAKTGKPTTEKYGLNWLPFTRTKQNSIDLRAEDLTPTEIKPKPKCEFWESFYPSKLFKLF